MLMLCKWLILFFLLINKINYNLLIIIIISLFNNNQTFDSHSSLNGQGINGIIIPLNNQTTTTTTPINSSNSTTLEMQRIQQWFRHNNTSPYTSPLPSNAPSIGDISGISSLFTENSTLTLNSHLSSSSKIIKNDTNPKDAISLLISIYEGSSPDLIAHSKNTLKLYFEAINKHRIPTMNDDSKDFRDIISVLLNKLCTSKENKMINALLDNLASISSSSHYFTVVKEQPIQTLRIFINLINQNALNLQQQYSINNNNNYLTSFSSSTTQRITHLLRIFYNTLYEVSDKNEARNEQMINSLLLFMRIPSSSIRFFSIGILRVLIHSNEQLKRFVLDQRGLDLILELIRQHNHHRFIRQALRTLTTLIDTEQQIFAERFVNLEGIDLIVSKMDINGIQPSIDDLFPALLILKLVSDIPKLSYLDLNRAVRLALFGTLPPSIPQTTTKSGNCDGRITGNAVDTYWGNIVNALGFLRNVCALNEKARNYLITFDEGMPISYLVELGTQCFDLLFCSSSSPSSSSSSPSTITTTTTTNICSSFTPSNAEQLCSINAEVNKSHVEIGNRRRQMLVTILGDCLCLLALLNKECIGNNKSKTIGREQIFASKKLAEDERAILLYQLILRLDRTEFQKSVLISLRRIINCKVPLPIESRGIRLAETLLKYLFTHNNSVNLTKIAVEVLIGLVCEQSRLHLTVITPLLSNDNYQPFKLLDVFSNYSDLYLSILKLTKELCQRESTLKALWFQNDNNLSTTSNNREIVYICSKIYDLLQIDIGEDSSESAFYDIFTQGMELDQNGISLKFCRLIFSSPFGSYSNHFYSITVVIKIQCISLYNDFSN
ncbi:hypothetical protein Mgra_00008189 [Meloidogyne graminicola]|uniref:Uncharacterized protein n=1 Tax=Meloidogyne graminicola TaxID=189291 RepID=A0A8S9ZGN5_9BILA|nr:hypothetical protein Mgra_00008189 [Meloidogyne graminicola]